MSMNTDAAFWHPKEMVKKALLIGINYIGTRSQLSGCINDVHNMHAFLQEQGYTEFQILTDEHGHELKPTRANILAALAWLVTDGCLVLRGRWPMRFSRELRGKQRRLPRSSDVCPTRVRASKG